MKATSTRRTPAGWIPYDDSCGICRRSVPFGEGALRRRGFDFGPWQADWVRAKLQLSETELLQDLRLAAGRWFTNFRRGCLSSRHAPQLVGLARLPFFQRARTEDDFRLGLAHVRRESLSGLRAVRMG